MRKWTVLTIVTAAGFLSLAQQIKCRSPTRYMIPEFKANWFKATEYCFSLGMQLAVTNSKQHHDRIVEVVKSSPIYKEEDTVVLLGDNDLGEEGVFYWHSTGVRLTYAHWQTGQPDNWKGMEDCVALVNIPASGWNWVANDGSCESIHYFVCENVESIHDVGVF
ncbi:C-type lectin 37Db-like [Ochlerotatus camptorhynchus]|uniref:C-type lectin 37Db-like n=1 Tax=Ochlerotatus camptorhynchus TaxID=644619 RepID=UPI0031E00DD9